MLTYLSILIGFVLDLILGDPEWMPHPVVQLGRATTAMVPSVPTNTWPGSLRKYTQ